MQQLFDALRKIHRLPEELKQYITSGLEEFEWQPGVKPVEVGQVNRYIYFIKSGLLYIRRPAEDESSVHWILGKNDFVIIPSVFATQEPSKDELVVADSVVALGYTKVRLDKTCEEFNLFNTHYKLITQIYRNREIEHADMLKKRPDERLNWLWAAHPEYFGRVTVDVICSYLGITKGQYYYCNDQRRGRGKI